MSLLNKYRILSLIGILILAVILRILAFQVIEGSRVSWMYEYEIIADNLVSRGSYDFSFYGLATSGPTSFIPPVYPFFLALARLGFQDHSETFVKFVQIGLSCLTILGLYALTRDLGGSNQQSLMVAFIASVYPQFVSYSIALSTVTLETLFVIFGIWGVVRIAQKSSLASAVAAGIFLSLAALTRSTWLILLPLSGMWLAWYYRGDWRKWGKMITFVVITAGIVFFPWIIYNFKTHGVFMMTSTNGGLNFWIGNNPNATGEYIFPTQINKDLVMEVAELPEVERDRFFYAQGFRFILESPSQFLRLMGIKLLYFLFFRPNIGSAYRSANIQYMDLARLGFIFAWIMLFPFALIGLYNLKASSREHSWLVLIFISQAMVSALYFTGTRFRTPIDGIVIIWAVIGLTGSLHKWKEIRQHTSNRSRKIE